MKRWLIFILLLLAPSVFGDSYLDERTDYYTAARLKLGLTTASSGELTDAAASGFFSEAATAILPVNRGIKRITSFVTTYRESIYELDTTLTGILAVWWAKDDSLKPLVYKSVANWSVPVPEKKEGSSGPRPTTGKTGLDLRPSFYDHTDSQIVIYPIPTKFGLADTIRIMGWHRIADVDTVTTPTVIPEKYRISILYHMVYNAAQAGQDPRVEFYFRELNTQLQRIGLSLTPGGAVVPAGN